jgi:hypothetical protein
MDSRLLRESTALFASGRRRPHPGLAGRFRRPRFRVFSQTEVDRSVNVAGHETRAVWWRSNLRPVGRGV